MSPYGFSSGDPQADRRHGFAEALAASGDMEAAAEALAGALERAPGWAAGWHRLGEWRLASGDRDGAASAWRRALEADPRDRFGARARLDLMSGAPVSESLPPAYVETLFDQYAPRFDASLTGSLSYRGPQIVMEVLGRAGFARAARALDLGCGTGLMGAALRSSCDHLEGWDISAAMLARARARGVYDALARRDINALEMGGPRYDLIAAADVFTYVGALERVVAWCADALEPGGWFACALEAGEAGVTLRETMRFAHAPDYLSALMDQAGFTRVEISACTLRRERGADVPGLAVMARAGGRTPDRDRDDTASLTA
ncbi:methyltransferase domain-containing protein [Alkalicaulis satelles]|uniref:Methyltransferase domain-containing protein n=1 Tax=Alkalicaulis satelles TaxID=2609175 RepID=A0A5M6ZK57_9PROT|nr:methyltransferase domain-containing protein [Alkalicaulis satelles]KAA5804057.1 methyltransferase domain-containing protein [Alkalicaulis satelles]